jgi:nickel/cobalt transporter (NicO) family protein
VKRRVPLRAALGATIVAIALLAPAAPALAHPLGNFTVNVYGGLIVQPKTIVVDYVVDMAEIPAFRERREIDANFNDEVGSDESLAYRDTTCASLADDVNVQVDGASVPLISSGVHSLAFPEGAGGLSTLRLECRLEGAAAIGADATISYIDGNFPDVIGWREVTAIGDGVTLSSSDVPAVSATDRLTVYPDDELPSDVRRADFSATRGGPRLAALPRPDMADQAVDVNTIEGRDGGLLASLVGRDRITPLLVAAMLLLALGVGALHALGPGHGKTLIGAFLVGAGGSARHAVGVGAAISVMHTASVLTLGLLVVSAERVFAPERVYPALGLASGLVALALGSVLLVARIHSMAAEEEGGTHGHSHGHGDGDHHHEPGGHGVPPRSPLSRRGLMALAFSGGILPSPSALVVLLASVSLGRTALGLALIAAFSLGLAGALIGVGIFTLRARDFAERRFTDRAARLLPLASAGAIAAMGMFLTVRGAMQL